MIDPFKKWRHYDWRIWRRVDRWFLQACEQVVVLTLPGWQTSEGVQAEIALAAELGKGIALIAPETVEASERAGG
jgi:uncharacterized protein DUF1937